MATTKTHKKEKILLNKAETPLSVPEGSTEFRIKKDGVGGPALTVLRGGVEREHHPVESFTVKQIVDRWGYSRDYRVQFTTPLRNGARSVKGGWRRLSLPNPHDTQAPPDSPRAGEVETSAPGTYLSPSPSASPLSETLALLQTMRDITRADADAAIRGVETRAERSLQADRERSQEMSTLMLEVFRLGQAPPPGRSSDDALARALDRIDQRLQRLEETEPEPEPEEEPEEDDEAQLARLAKNVKRHGMAKAAQDFLGEKSVIALAGWLPKIEAKIPELIEFLKPILRSQVESMGVKKPAAAAPPAAPPPAPPAPALAPRPLKKAAALPVDPFAVTVK